MNEATFTEQQLNSACNMARADVRRDEFPWRLREAMGERCKDQGHQMENACSVMLQVFQICKWCGERR